MIIKLEKVKISIRRQCRK